MTVAHLLRNHLAQTGEPQAAFARRIGLTPQTVSQLVRGDIKVPTADVRARLAADLAAILPVRSVVAHLAAQERRQMPGAADARKRLDADVARLDESRKRAEDLYLSGARDRAWFDATEATNAIESARIARELAALPVPIDPTDIRSHAAMLRQVALLIDRVHEDESGPILAELGIVVVGDGGMRVLYWSRFAVHLAGYGEDTAERFLGE